MTIMTDGQNHPELVLGRLQCSSQKQLQRVVFLRDESIAVV